MPAVQATPAAVETIERVRRRHGSIVIHQSGGCCDGSDAMCLLADELPPGSNDLELGRVAGVPFLIDADQYERWGRPEFLLDVAPGPAGGFSLEGTEGVRFLSRSPACPADSAERTSPSSGSAVHDQDGGRAVGHRGGRDAAQ
jgi:uncharacterized protein